MKGIKKIVMDPFCYKQFDKTKTKLAINFDMEKFADKINEHYLNTDKSCLKPGYADFCKHIFIENFTDSKVGYLEITEKNKNLIETCYEARTEKELPVLRRYFPIDKIELEPAKYLDIILYSKEQIQKENASMKNEDPNKDEDYDYGIISIKTQNVDKELPMDPITIMRNALGVSEGGSGIPLDREIYLKSVKFWENYSLIK